MFKNALIYRIGPDWAAPASYELQSALEGDAFVACTPSQELSTGWVSPRNEDNGALMENVAGQLILKMFIERKSVPGSAVAEELEKRCKHIEATTGRLPGRRQKKEMKEEIRFELLPRAFSKRSQCVVWFDTTNRLLVVGTGSQSVADLVITQLVQTFTAAGSCPALSLLTTAMSPSAAMALWLKTQEAPENFSIDRDCELRSQDDDRSVVRYVSHALDIAEITDHITKGKMPTKLALTWNSKVSFVLTDKGQVTKLEFIDILLGDGEDGGFDTDATIATGGLTQMLPDLIEALGGELATTGDNEVTKSGASEEAVAA